TPDCRAARRLARLPARLARRAPRPAPTRRARGRRTDKLPAPRLGPHQPLQVAPLCRRARAAPPRPDQRAQRNDERGTMNDELKANVFSSSFRIPTYAFTFGALATTSLRTL